VSDFILPQSWTVIAVQRPSTIGLQWIEDERSPLGLLQIRRLVDSGHVITAQRRGVDGFMELVAKARRQKG
jgi:hypothetical protein